MPFFRDTCPGAPYINRQRAARLQSNLPPTNLSPRFDDAIFPSPPPFYYEHASPQSCPSDSPSQKPKNPIMQRVRALVDRILFPKL